MANIYDGMTNTAQKILKDELKVQWTYNSNSIEGNTISEGDTAFIIEYGLTVKGKSVREHNEVLGHSKAIDIIYSYLDKDILTLRDMFDLHVAIQTNIVIDIECPIGDFKVVENGRYIKGDAKREFHPYPHPRDVAHLTDIWLSEFSNTTKQNLSQCEAIRKYTRSHIGFTSIHPFFDGNGRVARLLANISMLKNGYLPLIVSTQNRDIYIELLTKYNLSVSELNSNSKNIIEENENFEKLYEFFTLEYQNSKSILDELKSKIG
ncbi:MAG: Fic family protein [Campylobacterota bacterium]|nr:Fic family protein [Campylobacterota bacterium]